MNAIPNARGLILGLAAALAFLPFPSAAQITEVAAEGARYYGNVCGRCHNPRSPLERSDQEWVIIVNHMRVRANLTASQARSVLAFLQAMNEVPVVTEPILSVLPLEGRPPSRDAQVIERGRLLLAANACIGCHLVAGAGGQIGPTLDGAVNRRGADFVRRKLANPLFNNATSMMPVFGLSADEIEALTAYLATLR